jgi:small-conductance mechanosensitive channel
VRYFWSQALTGQILPAILIVVGAFLAGRLMGALVMRVASHEARGDSPRAARRLTLYRVLTSAVRYLVAFVALTMILAEFHVNTASLIAGAGIAGLALSFGAQRLVQDIMTGLFLLYEDQFQVGEQIGVPALGLVGTVTELGLRITRLRAPGGEELIIPNGLITQVTNYSRHPVTATVDLPLDPANNPRLVRQTLEGVARRLEEQYPGIVLVGPTAVAPGFVTWALSALVTPGKQGACALAMREAALAALAEHHIAIASGTGGAVGGA